ncbi:MAG TPA: hypothetical protein VKD45_08520, partial [Hyphomicrobiaceae bacterium]|nr:hypothetical protein [Hyphomicrobiaceae bacterium]
AYTATPKGHPSSLLQHDAYASSWHSYFRAFNGSVTLPVAGYDYGGNWTISTGGIRTRSTDD